MLNKTKLMIAAASVALMPGLASAATLASGGMHYVPDPVAFNLEGYGFSVDGGTPDLPLANNDLTDGTILGGNVLNSNDLSGGAISFKFTSLDEELQVINFSTTSPGAPFAGLRISWCAGVGADSVSCVGEESFIEEPVDDVKLSTVFSGVGTMKYLVASWDSVAEAGSDLDFRVAAAIPIPATGLLLLGALGGIGAMRRRKKA